MNLPAPEDVLPRSAKQALLVAMVLMIFLLVLAGETGSNSAFMYVGF